MLRGRNCLTTPKRCNYALKAIKKLAGIKAIKVWINHGVLSIGDDIMYILVAGRFRTDVLQVLQRLLSTIKNKIVNVEEVMYEEK